jgi:hypothetical protein
MNKASASTRAKGLGIRVKRLGLKAVTMVACLGALGAQPFAFIQAQPPPPIIVKIIPPEEKSELSGLADVLLGSLGLTGVIVVAAVLLGAVMAGVMFWIRSRSSP